MRFATKEILFRPLRTDDGHTVCSDSSVMPKWSVTNFPQNIIMPTVVTITFSPCVDKTIFVEQLIPDRKLKCGQVQLDPGGGGVNVARVLHRFNIDATAVFPSGSYTGKFLEEMLFTEKVPFLTIATQAQTRENIVIAETSSGKQYRLGMPAVPITPWQCEELIKLIEDIPSLEFLVVSGSLPDDIDINIMARLSGIAEKKKAKFIVDTKGKPLQQAIQSGVFLVKPNLGELAVVAGRSFIHDNEIEATAREVMALGRCEAMIISMGERGAMLITADHSEMAIAPAVKRKSTVGAGDSMVAGIILGLTKNYTLAEALRLGIACGTAATLNEGSRLCEPQDVYTLLKQIPQQSSL